MSNAFDTTNAPEREPTEIIKGDYVSWWRKDLATDYPTDAYTLSYDCRSEGLPSRKINIAAADSGGHYLVSIPSTTTTDYLVANYHWTAHITRNSDSARVTIDTGIFTVQPDKALDSTDPRSHALKMLAYIEAALLHRAENHQLDVLDYSMGETSASRDPEKLLVHRRYWQGELVKANRKKRARAGLSSSAIIKTRF